MSSKNTTTETSRKHFSNNQPPDNERIDQGSPKKRKIVIKQGVKKTQKKNETEAKSAKDKFVITKCSMKEVQTCCQCKMKRKISYSMRNGNINGHLCNENCLNNFKVENKDSYELNWFSRIKVRTLSDPLASLLYVRHCSVCHSSSNTNYSLTWQGMDFCSDICLLQHQQELGSVCLCCIKAVPLEALGKFCARFGGDIRPFCSISCLIQHRRRFNPCAYCLQDLSRKPRHVLKGSDRFCTHQCLQSFSSIKEGPLVANVEAIACRICHQVGQFLLKYVSDGFPPSDFCSEKCFEDYSSKYNADSAKCCYCLKFTPKQYLKQYTVFHKCMLYIFCSAICRNLFIHNHNDMVQCSRCNIRKFSRDTVKKIQNSATTEACSLRCLGLLQRNLHSMCSLCNYCQYYKPQMFSFPKSDGNNHYFCSLVCLEAFTHNADTVDSPNTPITSCVMTTPKPAGSQVDTSTMCQVRHDKGTMAELVETSHKMVQTEDWQPGKLHIPMSLSKCEAFDGAELESKEAIRLQNGDLLNLEGTENEINYMSVLREEDNDVGDNQFLANEESAKFSDLEQLVQPVRNLQEDHFRSDCVKNSSGVNDWGYWTAIRNSTPAVTELLGLDADEFNVSLGQFVQEVGSPHGMEYAIDTIYCLCLGIQKYLMEIGRKDNIFHDSEYQYFHKCLDRLASTFQIPPELSSFKVEENHLWETKQLGTYSPQVLTFTLIFFFAKYFKLLTVQNHLELSLKQIAEEFMGRDCTPEMITVKLSSFGTCFDGIQMILRRNDDVQIKCPVRLCRFYLTKCPPATKSNHQVFYLQPDKLKASDDGPFWFTTASLPIETLQRNLNLVRMVKEVNE